jgi:hypothetical protein
MPNEYSISVEDNQVKIYINGLIHLMLKKDRLLGFDSWILENASFKYCIEFYLQGGTILLEYDTQEKWAAVLKLLDRKDLCVGVEE